MPNPIPSIPPLASETLDGTTAQLDFRAAVHIITAERAAHAAYEMPPAGAGERCVVVNTSGVCVQLHASGSGFVPDGVSTWNIPKYAAAGDALTGTASPSVTFVSDGAGWFPTSEDLSADRVKAKYLLALINRVHMEADLDLLSLPVLAGTASQTEANARCNALAASLVAHFTDVGTAFADGSHQNIDQDEIDLINALAPAASLANCVTNLPVLATAMNNHLTKTGVHFHNDTTAALTYTNDPAAVGFNLAKLIVDLNQLRQYELTHNSFASF